MFLVFRIYNDEGYCHGGWDDFIGKTDTWREAIELMDTSENARFQIVDTSTMQIVEYEYGQDITERAAEKRAALIREWLDRQDAFYQKHGRPMTEMEEMANRPKELD